MRAAIVNDEHQFEIVELGDPAPRSGELVLRVRTCGICGSDLKVFKRMPEGSVLGHEFCGEIVAVGHDVDSWSEGQFVAAMPLGTCGHCAWCLADYPAHCADADMIGVGGGPGGFAEFVRVPAAAAVRLEGGTGSLGALVEPLAVGLHCVSTGEVHPGDRVLILGGGTVGAAVAVWARRFGADEVVISDLAAERREAASLFGATGSHDPSEGPTAPSFDVVFECVGAPGLIQTALDAAASRGRVVVAGVCLVPDELVPSRALMKEVDIRFAVYYSHKEFSAAATLVDQGDLAVGAFVSRESSLEEIGSSFERLLTTTVERKILIAP
jgi:(R,R)-butanediol dehydrogenase / meso-butanediol dehydrogenase / diacetyl reductase